MAQAYAHREKKYSAPIAGALVSDPDFRKWVLAQTRFAKYDDAELLAEKMLQKRSKGASNWWASHFQFRACDCSGCVGGKETDLLAVFEKDGYRFALHFEVKRPGDTFKPGKQQPEDYRTRAECWVRKAPRTVLDHQDAETILICDPGRLPGFSTYATQFDRVITIQEIRGAFPGLLHIDGSTA
jgi:hypothetical protein